MQEKIDIPDLDQINDLATAKFLLKHVVAALEAQTRALEAQTQTIEQLRLELSELKRSLFGQKSERVVPIDREISRHRRKRESEQERAERLAKSKAKRDERRAKRRERVPTEVIEHPVVADACNQCGASLEGAASVADEVSEEYEYVPAQVVRREHHRHRIVCACGTFHYGEPPQRVVEGGRYGPGLHAHVVVSKCADSIPLDRLARRLRRNGAPTPKSTLCDLFHRSAELLEPIADRVLALVAASSHINADETSIRVQKKDECRRAYFWDFIAPDEAGHTLVAYRFSPSRSGETPIDVLGESTGVLQVDGYTGYNQVTTPNKRTRAGCWAHARRKFFAAFEHTPDQARHALDLIRQLYEVEYEAAELDVLGRDRHKALRRAKSGQILTTFYEWAESERDKHRPKSALGLALRYAINQRDSLERFIDDPKIRLDNNIAEQHLRLIALGRKNFLFLGNNDAGRNLAVLQTLVSTCLANKVNPQAYLADVLLRIADHPRRDIDALLPWNWAQESAA